MKRRYDDSREEVHGVTVLPDPLLPVLHEVAQGHQGVVAHGDHVVQRPRLHGDQHDTCVELFLEDLTERER